MELSKRSKTSSSYEIDKSNDIYFQVRLGRLQVFLQLLLAGLTCKCLGRNHEDTIILGNDILRGSGKSASIFLI